MRCSTMLERRAFHVLLVGASGVFGSRLAERLALEPDVALTLAGRRAAPLEAVRAAIGGGAVRCLDRDTIEPRELAGYDLVIDAAGPFQASGTRLVEAAIAAGVDYLDLADAREWVVGFERRFDDAAKAAGVSLVTGASSIPALSHAAIDGLVAGWSAIDTLSIGIFPGNRAPRGRAVVEAILSYAGKPVRVWKGGTWRDVHGWGGLKRVDAGPAGKRWASICDTPEQDLLVERYSPRRSAEFHAGMELSLLHLGLTMLSLPVRWGLVRSLRPATGPLLAMAQWLLPFGSDKGAMVVEARGVDGSNRPVTASWRLNADANRGPYVPVLAAMALIRKARDGGGAEPGARTAAGLLTLADFAADFDDLHIAGVTIVEPVNDPEHYGTVAFSRYAAEST